MYRRLALSTVALLLLAGCAQEDPPPVSSPATKAPAASASPGLPGGEPDATGPTGAPDAPEDEEGGLVSNALLQIALAEEEFHEKTGSYGTFAEMEKAGIELELNPGITITVAKYDAGKSFCLEGTSVEAPKTQSYRSVGGEFVPDAPDTCADAAGVAGDSRTGGPESTPSS